jgi:hypothetical protein
VIVRSPTGWRGWRSIRKVYCREGAPTLDRVLPLIEDACKQLGRGRPIAETRSDFLTPFVSPNGDFGTGRAALSSALASLGGAHEMPLRFSIQLASPGNMGDRFR